MLGHVVEMCKASSYYPSATLYLRALPLLPGAAECIEAGVYSSLQPSNFRLRHAIDQPLPEDHEHRRAYHLLFDPQTSGGLIVALPTHDVAESYVERLHASGYRGAAIIGKVTEPRWPPVCVHLE